MIKVNIIINQICSSLKECARANFYKDPFKFVKKLYTSEKNGTLKASRVELERYLEDTHTDAKRHEPMSIPSHTTHQPTRIPNGGLWT